MALGNEGHSYGNNMTDEDKEDFRKIRDIMDHLESLYRENDWLAVDAYLRDYPLDEANEVQLVTLVRYSYPAREKLTEWWNFVAAVALRVDENSLHGIIG
jgi:hypothetical protein